MRAYRAALAKRFGLAGLGRDRAALPVPAAAREEMGLADVPIGWAREGVDGAGTGLRADRCASIHPEIASRNSRRAFDCVSPKAEQPGRSGAMAM